MLVQNLVCGGNPRLAPCCLDRRGKHLGVVGRWVAAAACARHIGIAHAELYVCHLRAAAAVRVYDATTDQHVTCNLAGLDLLQELKNGVTTSQHIGECDLVLLVPNAGARSEILAVWYQVVTDMIEESGLELKLLLDWTRADEGLWPWTSPAR
jgi:hypothetical protein